MAGLLITGMAESASSTNSTEVEDFDAHINIATNDGVLLANLIDGEDPESANQTLSFDTSLTELFVLVKTTVSTSKSTSFKVLTVNVPGTPIDAKVAKSTATIRADKATVVRLKVSDRGIQPGTYKLIVVATNSDMQESVEFTVTSPNQAELLTHDNAPDGPNIGRAALGGKVISVSGESRQSSWKPDFLVDGFTKVYKTSGGVFSNGWKVDGETAGEIILGFHNGKSAAIDTIGVDTVETTASPRTLASYDRASPIPKEVEVWVADRLEESAFAKVAEVRLWRTTAPQLIRFEPVDASFVKLKILNNHGAKETALSELMVFESNTAPTSILDEIEVNVADPALSGYIVSVTSAGDRNGAWQLTDGTSSGDTGWVSATTGKYSASYTPQDIVIGFGNDQQVYIDHIVLDPLAGPAGSVGDFSDYQSRNVVVSIVPELGESAVEVGRIELPKENQPVTVDVDKLAVRLIVRVLSNHGGKASALGEIRVIEGRKSGYRSVANGAEIWVGPKSHSGGDLDSEGGSLEATTSTPQPLERGKEQTGRLAKSGQKDRYPLVIETESTAALTIHLTGSPDVRIALRLINAEDSTVKSYMAAADTGREHALSWLVSPGDYVVEITETPINQVIAFDTSGSMGDRIVDLENAVRSYVADARADEYLNFVRFSDKVEPLLNEFTNDVDAIESALEEQFVADGATALLDAFYESTVLLQPRKGRQVIVAFTDGQDTSSKKTTETLGYTMSSVPLQVFSIGFGGSLTSYNRRTASTGHQFLNSVTKSGLSRYFPVQDSADLAEVFAEIGSELRARAEYTIEADYSDAKGQLKLVTTGEMIPGLSPPRFELILDASGSMKKTLGQQSRMTVAKTVLQSVLEQVPDSTEVALRVFGHRIREGQAGDCDDSELLVPFNSANHEKVSKAIDGVSALGTTPIAYSVEQAIADMKDTGEGETVVILVTDGEEECREDLLDVVQHAHEGGLRFSLNIVGFELDETTTSDLINVAAAGGGGFFAAADADQLETAMVKVISAPYVVLDGSGDVVAKGIINGEPLDLYTGVYDIVIEAAEVSIKIPGVRVHPNESRVVRLNRQGDSVGVERLLGNES